jgi:ketosteroid isomerase-like protein
MTNTPINATPNSGDQAGDDNEIATFVHRWAAAIVANDVEQIDRFTNDDWVLIDKPGPIPREGFHAVVAGGMLRHETMTHDVLAIRRFGSDVAIVTTHGRNTGAFQGQPFEADEWTTNILIRGSDGWRCTLTQLTPRQPNPAA